MQKIGTKNLNFYRLGLVQQNFFWPVFSIFNNERYSVGLLFPTYRAQKLMKEDGEEWERKGFTAVVGWGLVEKGGYVVVGLTFPRHVLKGLTNFLKIQFFFPLFYGGGPSIKTIGSHGGVGWELGVLRRLY